jgi:hypothetical protein
MLACCAFAAAREYLTDIAIPLRAAGQPCRHFIFPQSACHAIPLQYVKASP